MVTSAINYINAQHSYTFYCTSESCSKELSHPAKLTKFKGELCSLWCDKLTDCVLFPSGYKTWQLDSSPPLTEPTKSVTSTPQHPHCDTRLEHKHVNILYGQLSEYASKWAEIGIHLGFRCSELNNIEAKPALFYKGPKGFLLQMLSDWLEWAPGDERGSNQYATLEALKRAVSSAGLGATAGLNITRAVTTADSARSHSASCEV